MKLSRPPSLSRFLLLLAGLIFALLGQGAVAPAQAKSEKSSSALTLRAAAHPEFDRLIFEGPRGLTYEMRREETRVTIEFRTSSKIDLRPVATLTRAKDFIAKFEDKNGAKVLLFGFTVAADAIVKDSANSLSVIVDIVGASPNEAKSAKTEAAETPHVATSAEPTAANSEKPASAELALVLDPKVVTGAVVFTRSGYGTIIFDRKLALNELATPETVTKLRLEQLDLDKNSGFRFPLPENTDIRATRNGTAWTVYFTRKRVMAVSARLVAQPDFALGARLVFPTREAPDPVRYTDPIAGDLLILVPLRETESFSAPRRYVDFSIIPAAQGLVVKPRHEKVTVRAFAEGVEIMAEGGLKLSPAEDTSSKQKVERKDRPVAVGRTIFDIETWRGKSAESFTRTRQKLMQTVVDVPAAEQDLARLELARFYFANGMGLESLSILGILSAKTPDLATHAEFLALRGASRILAGRVQDGLNDLNAANFTDQPEITLWQAVGAAQLRDWKTAEEKFNLAEDELVGYPDPFYSQFSVLAVEAALSVGKDREAAEWLDRLEIRPHVEEVDPAIHYLRGVIISKSGNAEAAQNLWRQVAQSSDRLYKIRAELALVDLGVATHSLTPLQATERLEGLRYAWRGDDLEEDILHRLGNFHIEAKNFKAGLMVLKQAVQLFPNTPLTPTIRQEMVKTFHDLFLSDLGKDLTPLEALMLYDDFRELMPTGDEGNAVGRNLAERLVSIDMLDQAASILEAQVRNTLKGEEKVKAGTRLAAIRLLDHRPDDALAALDMSAPEGNTPSIDVATERLLLRARAMMDKKKFDEALGLLADRTEAPAKMLRADINMRAQRWSEAANTLIDLIGPPPRPGEVLTDNQAQWLVNTAIALSLAEDTPGLDRLAIDFSAAMAATPQNDTFRVLTRPEKAGPMKNIAAAQSRIAEVDMFRGFLDAYRGKPAAAKKDEKKAK